MSLAGSPSMPLTTIGAATAAGVGDGQLDGRREVGAAAAGETRSLERGDEALRARRGCAPVGSGTGPRAATWPARSPGWPSSR